LQFPVAESGFLEKNSGVTQQQGGRMPIGKKRKKKPAKPRKKKTAKKKKR